MAFLENSWILYRLRWIHGHRDFISSIYYEEKEAMKICVFCGANSSLDPEVEIIAKKMMADFKRDQVDLVYGGAAIGIMGTLASELMSIGGEVTGVIPQHLMTKEVAHPGLTHLHVVKDMHERKHLMYKLSDAFLILPGGMGTLDELFEIVTWRQLGLHAKPIALLNINNYFDHLLLFLDHTVSQGLVKEVDRQLIFSSSNWDDVKKHLLGN
jgi:uncharacterized protein (TIGR00730 family)